jgi:hypothetical protein
MKRISNTQREKEGSRQNGKKNKINKQRKKGTRERVETRRINDNKIKRKTTERL